MKHPSTFTPIERANFKNAKLLIIEDDADHATIITHAAQQSIPEVKTVLVTNEAETLAYLNQCTVLESELPRLILLDLYMPDRQTGWRLLESIRSLPAALKIPVILLSRSDSRNDITEAYYRGCSSYLVKPADLPGWEYYFQTMRHYWWETVSLPHTNRFSVF